MGTEVVSSLESSLTFPYAVKRLASDQAKNLEADQVYGAVCSEHRGSTRFPIASEEAKARIGHPG